MTIHQVSKKDWDPMTWIYPRIHNYNFGFGLSAENALKGHTIMPYFCQDNALIDYETIKTNPENADFAVVTDGQNCAGSYIPKITVGWDMFIKPDDTEITKIKVDTMVINTSMLNRLDAFDKKTGNDIETILELAHETTDEQCYPLFTGNKLFESHGTYDLPANQPGLTANQQPEGVAWDKELYFDALHYYTNKEMLKTVTQRMRTHTLVEPIVPHGRAFIHGGGTMNVASLCKFQHPYTFCGELFSVPQVGDRTQYHLSSQTTAVEHVTVTGFVRYNEFNPDFNFSRA